jgi:hypothetical protein
MPASIRSWMVVDFAACDMQVLSRFIHDLQQAMAEKGHPQFISRPYHFFDDKLNYTGISKSMCFVEYNRNH